MNTKTTKLVLCIDGPRGIGKNTQIGLLSQYFNSKNIKTHSVVAGKVDEQYIDFQIEKSKKMLEKDTNICIIEGSFLRVLAQSFADGLNQSEVIEQHSHLIALNEKTRGKYPVLNIMLYNEDTHALADRIKKKHDILGIDSGSIDHKKEADIQKRIVGFEKSMMNLNTNTKVLHIDIESPILEVHQKLLEEINLFLQ